MNKKLDELNNKLENEMNILCDEETRKFCELIGISTDEESVLERVKLLFDEKLLLMEEIYEDETREDDS